MQATFKIQRYNPEKDKKPYWAEYSLEVDAKDRILDILHKIKWEMDGSLSFRRSCAHGICGSDAMMINGRNRLACKVLMMDLGTTTVTVEAIRGLPVEKDLIVDMKPFFDSYEAVMPYFIGDAVPPATEYIQSHAEEKIIDASTKCILCACCTTSCPIFWVNGQYLGPAAIVQAHRFIFDSRDRAGAQRLEILNQTTGVWRCRTAYNCTEACPRDIPITEIIGQVKRALMYGTI